MLLSLGLLTLLEPLDHVMHSWLGVLMIAADKALTWSAKSGTCSVPLASSIYMFRSRSCSSKRGPFLFPLLFLEGTELISFLKKGRATDPGWWTLGVSKHVLHLIRWGGCKECHQSMSWRLQKCFQPLFCCGFLSCSAAPAPAQWLPIGWPVLCSLRLLGQFCLAEEIGNIPISKPRVIIVQLDWLMFGNQLK